MSWIVGAFAVLITVAGAVGVVWPELLLEIAERPWQSRGMLLVAAALRVGFGVLLLLVAPNSRFPTALVVLGWIAIAAGLLIPALGPERVQRFVAWWRARPPGFVRAWAAVALAFGVFLAFAVAPALG